MYDWAELRHFRYLLAILERQGFRVAAEQLHTSQPNLTVQARQFQENASIRLFRKMRNGRTNPATDVFATDRLTFLDKSAGFRSIDLHWCLTLEPSKVKAFERKPDENAVNTSRRLADLEKTAVILVSHLGNSLGLRLLDKTETFQFFSYLFNLEEWSEQDQLRSDAGVDRQIVKSPVAWHSDHLRVGKRHVQMFSLKTTPEASRPCLFSGLLSLDCDSVLCSSWRVKSASAARSEIDAQEKFISFFKVGVLTRVMSGRDGPWCERDSKADFSSEFRVSRALEIPFH